MTHATARRAWALLSALLLAPALHAADVKPTGVTVSGSGSVGIGSMTGGEIKIGLTPDEVKALEKATAREAVALLTPILTRINAQITQLAGSAREDKIALGVAEAFLATIKGKKIPTSEWSVEFGEATRNYLRLGTSIEATPVTSDRIKDLVSRADSARKLSKFDEADAALAEAAELATQDAQRIQQQALTSTRQAASLHASRANLAFTRLERGQGALLLEKAFEFRKGDVSSETLWWLLNAGNAWTTEGQSAAALRVYTMAQSAAASGSFEKASDATWQRTLSVANVRLGDARVLMGDSSGAMQNYQAGLVIAKRLAADNPLNLLLQQDLSIGYSRLAKLQEIHGDNAAALESRQNALAIDERLATADPANTEFQSGLAIEYRKIGAMQLSNGDPSAALRSFELGRAVSERLSAGDPMNLRWKTGVGNSFEAIGVIQASQGETAASLKSFQAAMAIFEELTGRDPGNSGLQAGVAHMLIRVGIAQFKLGDPVASLKSFQAGLAIYERLSSGDPANAEWQRSLALSYPTVGILQLSFQNDSAKALKSFQASLAASGRLVAIDPRNTDWQRIHSMAYLALANIQEAGSVDERLTMLMKGLEIVVVQRNQGTLPPSGIPLVKQFESAIEKLKRE